MFAVRVLISFGCLPLSDTQQHVGIRTLRYVCDLRS